MAPPLLSLRGLSISFGGPPLFESVDLAINKGDRMALVGRNGAGKSTLLKAIAGSIEQDAGDRHLQPGTHVSYLAQTPDAARSETIADYIAQGLEAASDTHRVARWLDTMQLDGASVPESLSGGELRRAALARALISEPGLLLLDEPTNHLDLPGIEWLESSLDKFAGGLVLVSHDRALLTRLSKTTLWLDRGALRRLDKGFQHFDTWSEEALDREDRERHKLERLIASETRWSHEGITARRKRNQGRLRRLEQFRRERAAQIARAGRIRLRAGSERLSGRLVIEATEVSKAFGTRTVIREFSARIMRGDRVAIIGPNGAGKTTLLRILIGDLPPDAGQVRLGENLDTVYLDQSRAGLDPEKSLWDTLLEQGGDQLVIQGQPRHVVTYLRDFLFAENQARSPVSSLSGGEQNRLLLAKALAQPANLLVLDEPTNDLDIDTLDLLQEMLADFDGTVLFASHDRDFIDRVATSTIAIESDGRVTEYAGGYSDYLSQRRMEPTRFAPKQQQKRGKPRLDREQPTRLSYNQQRALEELPEKIAALENEIADLETTLADPELFARDAAAFESKATRLAAAKQELSAVEEEWLVLEELRESLGLG